MTRGNYQLLFLGSTQGGGGASGRFLDLIGPSAVQEMREFYAAEEKIDPHIKFVETSFIPYTHRSANVVIAPHLRQNRLDLSSAGQEGCLFPGADLCRHRRQ